MVEYFYIMFTCDLEAPLVMNKLTAKPEIRDKPLYVILKNILGFRNLKLSVSLLDTARVWKEKETFVLCMLKSQSCNIRC